MDNQFGKKRKDRVRRGTTWLGQGASPMVGKAREFVMHIEIDYQFYRIHPQMNIALMNQKDTLDILFHRLSAN